MTLQIYDPEPLGQSHTRRRPVSLLCVVVSILGTALSVLSCSGDTLNGPPQMSPAETYWALQLNQYAVNLALTAPYDTVQLIATPSNVAGAPLSVSSLGTLTYSAVDSTVSVSATGLVTARYPTQQTEVIVKLQDSARNQTHADTVYIQVTPVPPRYALATFTLHPAPSDSAKRSADYQGGFFSWPLTVTNVIGDTLCNPSGCSLQVHYSSSNPYVATIDQSGTVGIVDTGRVVFTVTTLAYGVARHDTVPFTIGNILRYDVLLNFVKVLGVTTLEFQAPKVLVLSLGGTLEFNGSALDHPTNVIFSEPAAADTATWKVYGFDPGLTNTGRGNIPAVGGDTVNFYPAIDYSARSFHVPGVYFYHSSLFPSDTLELIVK